MNLKKIIITGAPGTGKSTLINKLVKRGYTCKEEISRALIIEAQKDGVDQLFLKDPLLFSKLLLQGRLKQFNETDNIKEHFVFFDRGIPDVLAYMDFIGNTYPVNFIETTKNAVYDMVFILKPWKSIYKIDNERYETFEQAKLIHKHLEGTYKTYNYSPITIPFGTVDERINFIFKTLQKK